MIVLFTYLSSAVCTTDFPPLLRHESILFVVGDIDYNPITTLYGQEGRRQWQQRQHCHQLQWQWRGDSGASHRRHSCSLERLESKRRPWSCGWSMESRRRWPHGGVVATAIMMCVVCCVLCVVVLCVLCVLYVCVLWFVAVRWLFLVWIQIQVRYIIWY